jgi:hypothetical protein
MTFIRACEHIENFTSGHETRTYFLGPKRLEYPNNHIEADNRLSWFLGRMDETFGDNAFYVHLVRNREDTANSFAKRYDKGIIHAYSKGILIGRQLAELEPLDICKDYVDTVNSNIEHFLKDKSHKMYFPMENAKDQFEKFWTKIGAEGDLQAALTEWDVQHNASGTKKKKPSFSKKLKRLFSLSR